MPDKEIIDPVTGEFMDAVLPPSLPREARRGMLETVQRLREREAEYQNSSDKHNRAAAAAVQSAAQALQQKQIYTKKLEEILAFLARVDPDYEY